MAGSADAMQAQEKIQIAMKEMINDLDKTRLRKLQLKMHLCAAKCCQNESISLEQAQRCVEDCSAPVQAAQNFVQQEIGQFQERLQRCVLECQDKAKDKLGVNPSDAEVEQTKYGFEKCAIRCVDDSLKLIPTLLKRMQKALDAMK